MTNPGAKWLPSIFILLQLVSPAGAAFAQQQTESQQKPPEQPSSQKQQPPAAPQATPEQEQKEQSIQTQEQQTGTSNDRLFWTLPNFLTLENASQIPPLTTGQKFKVVARGSFDYVEYPWYAFLSAISQAENSEPGFGQGAAGYGKRYATTFADGTIENFVTGAILPSMLRQDPRYFQLGERSFWHRTGYSISRIFVTRTDSGGEQFNYSEIMGSALSAGISTYSYHPGNDRNVRNSLSVWGSQIGYDTVAIVVKEFWPDIRRHFTKK